MDRHRSSALPRSSPGGRIPHRRKDPDGQVRFAERRGHDDGSDDSRPIENGAAGDSGLVLDRLPPKWEAKSREKLVDIYTPIYRKYFTLSEIREMIAFYETPVGQKLATSLPAITQEGFAAGQQLGEEIAAEMIRELQQL